MKTTVHPRVSRRHPELSDEDVRYAWENAFAGSSRLGGPNHPEYIRVGYDKRNRLVEMVGVQAEDGWLVFHAMTPPSKKTLKEIANAERRSKNGIQARKRVRPHR